MDTIWYGYITVGIDYGRDTLWQGYITVGIHYGRGTLQQGYIMVGVHYSRGTLRQGYITVGIHYSRVHYGRDTLRQGYIMVGIHYGRDTLWQGYITVGIQYSMDIYMYIRSIVSMVSYGSLMPAWLRIMTVVLVYQSQRYTSLVSSRHNIWRGGVEKGTFTIKIMSCNSTYMSIQYLYMFVCILYVQKVFLKVFIGNTI